MSPNSPKTAIDMSRSVKMRHFIYTRRRMSMHDKQRQRWAPARADSYYYTIHNIGTTRPYDEVFRLLTPFGNQTWRNCRPVVVDRNRTTIIIILAYWGPFTFGDGGKAWRNNYELKKYIDIGRRSGCFYPSFLRLCYSWGEIEEASGGFWWCISCGASSVSEIENNQITLLSICTSLYSKAV